MIQRNEFSSLNNDLKQRLHDAEADVYLARIEKTALAKRFNTLALENRGL